MALGTTVPVVHELHDVYSEDFLPAESRRWQALRDRFREVYGRAPQYIARAPGRVSLIGEHIDYCEFTVLPCAIRADVVIAFSTDASSDELQAANMNASRFPARSIELPPAGTKIEIDSTELEWSNYLRAGFRGALELLDNKARAAGSPPVKPVGMKVLVHGTVPTGSGLSSSAAFTCASALAVLVANAGTRVSKEELTQLAIVSERFVGVNSGGMDQAASVYGEKGKALSISFKPHLLAEPVAFPDTEPKFSFVLANTLTNADKHTTGPVNYNLRVVETTLAAEILARLLRLGDIPPRDGFGCSLWEVTRRYHAKEVDPCQSEEALQDMLRIVDEHLAQREGYTRTEMAALMGMSETDLVAKYMTRFPVRADRFQLHDRSKHVFSEAIRVIRFKKVLTQEAPATVAEKLGAIMNESQASCRDLYNASCPEIEELTKLAMKSGAYGSRLTGAGWGGMTCSLVASDKVPAFIESLRTGYYAPKFPNIKDLSEIVFPTLPGTGAVVYE